eukprot:2280289-Amphidinium_carterae.1
MPLFDFARHCALFYVSQGQERGQQLTSNYRELVLSILVVRSIAHRQFGGSSYDQSFQVALQWFKQILEKAIH